MLLCPCSARPVSYSVIAVQSPKAIKCNSINLKLQINFTIQAFLIPSDSLKCEIGDQLRNLITLNWITFDWNKTDCNYSIIIIDQGKWKCWDCQIFNSLQNGLHIEQCLISFEKWSVHLTHHFLTQKRNRWADLVVSG